MNFENNMGALQPFEHSGNNPLIETLQNEKGDILVSGRELHEFLEVSTPYAKWFDRMTEYGFEENQDFVVTDIFVPNSKGGRQSQRDHHMKIEMAKEVAMIQRNEKGKQARRYFLQIEKLWNSPEMVMKRALGFADYQVKLLSNENQQLTQVIEEQRPKVIFADAVSVSKTTILIGDLAKFLKQNGYETGANRLFEQLRNEGYLIKRRGSDYNSPTQKSMELGLFEVKETPIVHSDGHVTISKTTKVTGKGQVYFMNKFLEQK